MIISKNETVFNKPQTETNSSLKKAFTLAELLITIAIVGVVAALTIPTLVKKYEKRTIEVGIEKTYADLINLIKLSEVDNGSFVSWDYSIPPKFFVEKYFAPYIDLTSCYPPKINQQLQYPPQPCFAGSDGNFYLWRYPGFDKFENEGCFRVSPKYLLKDGRSIMFMSDYDEVRNRKTVTIVVDVNGQRGRSVMGEDVFMFSLVNFLDNKGFYMGVASSGGASHATIDQLYQKCQPGNPGGTHSCGEILRRNNWKFPDDYPIKF